MGEKHDSVEPEDGNMQQPQKIAAAKDKRKGCLKWCLIIAVVLIVIGGSAFFLLWRALNPRPGPIAQAMAKTAADEVATEAVNRALVREGMDRGVTAVVIPLPDERGNPAEDMGSAVLFAINLTDGFVLAETEEGVRQQTLQIVRAAVEANRNEGLDIKYSGSGFYHEGEPVASMSTSIEAMEAWVDGRISDEEFLRAVTVKIHDVGYYIRVAREYLGTAIVDAVFGAIFQSIFRR